MAGRRGGDHPGLVRHQLQATRRPQGGRLGQVHARGGSAVLERPEQRAEQLPAVQAARGGPALTGGGEVGRQEGVGELPGDDRLRHHPALGRRGGRHRLGRRGLLGGRLDSGGPQHLRLEGRGRAGHDGVLGEQRQERGVAGGGLGQDRRQPVEALQLLGTAGGAEALVGLDAGPLLAHQQGDDLERRAPCGPDAAAFGRGLDLAHGAGEHRDDALLIEGAGAPLGTGRGPGGTGLALASSSQELLLSNAPARWPWRCATLHRSQADQAVEPRAIETRCAFHESDELESLVNRPSCTSTTTSTYLTPRPPCRPSDHRSNATSPTAESELSLDEPCGGRCCPDLSPLWCEGSGSSEISDGAALGRPAMTRSLSRVDPVPSETNHLENGNCDNPQTRRNRPWWGIRGRFRFFAELPGSKERLVKVSGAEWERRWPRSGRADEAHGAAHRCDSADSGGGHSGHPGSCRESPGSGATNAFRGQIRRGPESQGTPITDKRG